MSTSSTSNTSACISPRHHALLSSVHARVARHFVLHNTDAAPIVNAFFQRQNANVSPAIGRRGTAISSSDFERSHADAVLNMFFALVQDKSWSSGALIELVKVKFEHGYSVLRVDGEAIAQFSKNSCLLRVVKASALQKQVLDILLLLCGWSWAFVQFEANGLVVRNRNNAKVAYPLAASLRIALPDQLVRLCTDVRSMLAAASSFAERPSTDAADDADVAPEKPTRIVRRRSGRLGFCRQDESRALRLQIERNILFPSTAAKGDNK